MPTELKVRRVGVDVDGVLADLHSRFLHLLNKDAKLARDASGKHYTPCTLEDITDWDTWKAIPILRDIAAVLGKDYANALTWRYFDLAWLKPHRMPAIEGAAKAMHALSERKDLEVEIVTSRRMESAGDLMTWLNLQKIPCKAVVILDAHDKVAADKSQRGYDVLVDDSPRLATAMAGHPERTLLLFDKPYNRGGYTPNVRRVGSWKQPSSSWTEVIKYFK